MKLPRFDYARPASLPEAVALLQEHDGAKILAGGQSLLPVMAFRLAAPPLLVDIGGLDELTGIAIGPTGIRLGARVRWRDIEEHAGLADSHPLLVAMVAEIAHYQIRTRGTVGGSLAHADPAAEMPAFAVACDGDIVLTGPAGTRIVAARDFFTGALETVLQPDEIIVELRVPPWPRERRWGFEEFSRRRGDFALAGAAAFYDTAEGCAENAHLGVFGVEGTPRRLAVAEALLNGRIVTAETIEATAAAAARAVEPIGDLHAEAAYRRALVSTLAERALRRAAGLGAVPA